MEPLILEIAARGLHRYHRIEADVTSIGRALDNDIILSDPTVAAHHLKIIRYGDDSFELVNLSEVNPTRVDRKQIDSLVGKQLPLGLEIGRIQARLLAPDHAVAAARPLPGGGRRDYLFGHASWAVVLVCACLVAGGLEFYLNLYNSFKWVDLAKYLLRETVLTIGIFVLALAILERLLVNRWEIKQLIISVSLVLLLYHVIGNMADSLDYLFSSSWPGMLILFGWNLVLIPAAITLYLMHISHLATNRSIILAVLIASPIALPALLQSSDLKALLSDFSASASYHNSLSSFNWHLADRVSVETFIEQAKNLEAGKLAD